MRVLLTGMSGVGKSTTVRELRRRGFRAYDADDDGLRTRTTNSYGRDGAQLSRALSDLDEIEPLLRRSADLVLETTEPPSTVVDRLLLAVDG
jgi:hypothetical protein